MVTESYIKLYRSRFTDELMKNSSAFMLLTQIAIRARRTDVFNVENLKLGEALLGDYKSIGLTRQKYRTALKNLEKWDFITIKSTSKGSVATICNNEVYDINISSNNQQANHRATIDQPSSNHQATTNKNVKNEKNVKNVNYEQNKKFRKNIKTNKGRFKIEEKPDYTEKL